MRRKLKSVVAAAAVGLFAVAVSPVPAYAVDGWQRTADVSEGSYENGYAKECAIAQSFTLTRAKGCFQPYGEWIWLQDRSSNNEPVGLQWWYTEPGGGGARSGVAYWDGTAASGWTNLNKSFTDHGDFTFRVCEVNLPSRAVVESTCSDTKSVST